MSDEKGAEGETQITDEDVVDNDNPEYKPPAPKALTEIISADQEDEALQRYKAQLLGNAAAGGATAAGARRSLPPAPPCGGAVF